MRKSLATVLIIAGALLLGSYAGYRWHRRIEYRKGLADTSGIFTFNVIKHDPSVKGYLLLTPFAPFKSNNGSIIVMGMDGTVYYQRNLHHPTYDLRQWKINGRIYYSYIMNDAAAYHVPGIKLTAGHVVILDSAFNEIRQVHLQPNDDVTTEKHQDLDLHEFIMLSENHFITMAGYEKAVSNIPASLHPSPRVKVVAPIIQETIGDSVVWQWDASHFPELYATSTWYNHFSDSTLTQDYLHFNAFFLDPRDSNIICSFRCSNQLVKVSRKTGAILWKLGGNASDFPMAADQLFYRQHDPTLTDDNQTLLLFDNGDSLIRKNSRILEFRLDEVNKKITSFKATEVPGRPAYFMGLVAKDGTDYFMGTGTGNSVMQIDRHTGAIKFEMTVNQLSYRAYKVDSIYGLEKRGAVMEK